MKEERGYVILKKVIEKFHIECEYCGENENNNRNIVQIVVIMRGTDNKMLTDISFSTTEDIYISDLSDSEIIDYCYEFVKDNFEMKSSEQDKHKFFKENSELEFVESDIYLYDGAEIERAIKSIEVECTGFADQEECEDKEYTINAKVLGYDDEEYWNVENEEIMVTVEEDDNEEELVIDAVTEFIIEKIDLGISEEFIRNSIEFKLDL